jgi:predicted dehydrogenase
MPRRIKWGVIGSGGIARRRTIPEGFAVASNAELASVFDVDDAANQAVAASFGARACRSIEELLQSGVEAVYVASPVKAHHGQILSALAAGKHVLCEKPLGLNVAEAEEVVSAADKAGLLLGTAFMMRFQSQHEALRRMAEHGLLGTLVFGRAQLSCWYPPIPGAWRQDPALGGGGALIDMGCHAIDVLENIFGPVRKLCCFTASSVQNYASEDNAVVLLSFASGATGTVDTLYCVPDESSKNRLEVYGSLGSVLAEGTIGQGSHGRMTAYLRQSQGVYEAQQIEQMGNGVEITPPAVNTYRAEVEDFSLAILEGRPPRADGRAGLWSQRLIDSCYASARNGVAVELR